MITIMTPTYNRAYILENTYRSLCEQTSFEFEWIVIDDGSIDETESLIEKWKAECKKFNIIYLKQQNGGKHRAINKAVNIARYDWFFILDSDDQLTPTAVECIHTWIVEVANLNGIAGVAGLKGTHNQAIGGYIKQSYIDATNLERKKYGLLGDKAEIYKTSILRQYPFPEFAGENFLRESAVWDSIAKDGLKLRWFNSIIYICEYIEDGLTKNVNNKIYAKNFCGFTYCTNLYLETHSFPYDCLKIGHYYDVSKINNLSNKQIIDNLHISNTKLHISLLLNFAKKILIGGRKLIYGIHNTKSKRS